MSPDETDPIPDPAWEVRRRDWVRKLGRLRLGVEPIAEQLARYKRATQLLSWIPLGIGLIIVAIFTAFRRPDVGLVVAAVLLIPIVALAWLDFARLSARASAYLRDLHEHESQQSASKTRPPGEA